MQKTGSSYVQFPYTYFRFRGWAVRVVYQHIFWLLPFLVSDSDTQTVCLH